MWAFPGDRRERVLVSELPNANTFFYQLLENVEEL